MTTTIKKGAGRPAAAARRAKAAQRPTDNLGSMTLTELRRYALDQGWSTATKEGKAALLRILRANPDGPPKAVGKNGGGKTAPTSSAPKVREYRPITSGLSGTGTDKAARVGQLLRAAGWKVDVAGVSLSARRGEEVIAMAWTEKGAHVADLSTYRASPDAKPKRLINVATALRQARGGAR